MSPQFLLIRQAILERKQVIATYKRLYREMCPHVLGFTNGRARCLFYQFGGESTHGIFPANDPRAYQNWRCMEVDLLELLSIRDGEWHSLSRETRPQTCVQEIELEIADEPTS